MILPLPDTTSKPFEMSYDTVESFHSQSFFHSGFEKFWVLQISFRITTKLNKINVKKKANSI